MNFMDKHIIYRYDKMSEATAVKTSPETPTSSAQEKVVPEYLR